MQFIFLLYIASSVFVTGKLGKEKKGKEGGEERKGEEVANG